MNQPRIGHTAPPGAISRPPLALAIDPPRLSPHDARDRSQLWHSGPPDYRLFVVFAVVSVVFLRKALRPCHSRFPIPALDYLDRTKGVPWTSQARPTQLMARGLNRSYLDELE